MRTTLLSRRPQLRVDSLKRSLACPSRPHPPHFFRLQHQSSARCSAAAPSTDISGGFLSGEDFYTILGVAPTADAKEIKRAYHALMRDVHPDRTSDEYSHDLCTILNEIYDVLSDPDRRETYDVLSGFSADSVNPFFDATYERDQVFVDEVTCIGCGKCARQCPATFIIEGSKYGRARVISQTADEPDEIQVAIETCPVDCIHWVSVPQLSLLEAALATMGRIEVYIMMRYGRSTGEDVFQVASKAWDRRMEKFRRKQETIFSWETLSFRERTMDGGDHTEHPHHTITDREGRQIANLAAAAARAARLWRAHAPAKEPVALLADAGQE